MEVTIFGIHLTLNPVLFTINIGSFHWDIYWYGLLIALGFILALVYAIKNHKRFDINFDRMLDVVLITVPLAVLCARAYYLIFDDIDGNLFEDFFNFSDGQGFSGLAIYGGVIGAFSIGALMCKLRKVNILDMFDLTAIGFLIGQAVGRWGNFVNQEAFGGPTGSSFWGMTSQNVVDDFIEKGYDPTALAHPCFLYESVWCVIGFLLLHHFSKKRKFKGQIALMYCIWYGLGRAIIEGFRTDSLKLGAFRVSQLLSLLLVVVATILLVILTKKLKEKEKEPEYVAAFAENGEEDIEQPIEENENDQDN